MQRNFIIENGTRRFNITNPLSVIRFACFLIRLKRREGKLNQRLSPQVKKNLADKLEGESWKNR